MSSAGEGSEVGLEGVEGFASDVALEAAEDLAFVQAVAGALCGVGLGAWAVAETADGDHVERAVGLSVAAGVEAVAGGAAGACLDGCGAADLGEGGFAAEPLDVLAGGDEELARALGADSKELGGAWRGDAHQLLELAVEVVDLAVELADAAGEARERQLGCLLWFVDSGDVGAQSSAQGGFRSHGAAFPEVAAELLGRGDDQVVELLQRRVPRFQRARSDDLQLPDRFHDPARLFRDRGRGAAG